MIGTTGTNGTRKPRCRSGRVRRRMITPTLTMMNANSVPMLTSLKMMSSGTSAARTAMKAPNISVIRTGVWVRADTTPRARGTRPSRLMANRIRVWPYNTVRHTLVIETRAPSDRSDAAQPKSRRSRTVASGAASPSRSV